MAVGKTQSFQPVTLLILLTSGTLIAHDHKRVSGPILPIPLSVEFDEKRAQLGRKLFSDKLLSKDQTISCESCHRLDTWGVDNRPVSIGIGGRKGIRNSPTVFNSRFNFQQFWDGRARDLEDQTGEPLTNPIEMGSSWELVISRLSNDSKYRKMFDDLYPDGIREENIRNAIAEFEKSLITPNSRFDNYLRGDESAITDVEKSGYLNFRNYGCIACHQGVAVGGNMFQKLGIFVEVDSFFKKKLKSDFGRELVTKRKEDRYFFKVPSLRNVAKTAPYFHDGSVANLSDAVAIMGRVQLGVELKSLEIESIVAFLESLSGKPQGAGIAK